MFIYSDTGPRSDVNIDVWRMNGTRAYLNHYENYLYLDFISRNGSFQERGQAEKEMKICRRKMSFWEKHPNYNPEAVTEGKAKLNKMWQH